MEHEVPHHARGRSRAPHCRRFTRWREQDTEFFYLQMRVGFYPIFTDG